MSLIARAITRNGGWLPFDRFMAMALYAPGLGYYSRNSRQFGLLPGSGSDFVTAPELSPLFGKALAQQVAQALDGSATNQLWEFGAGSGALALQLLDTLGDKVARYRIVDLSGALRERQQERLRAHTHKLEWLDALPDTLQGVVVGNEVLDAMPVQLLYFDGQAWHERGVVLAEAFIATVAERMDKGAAFFIDYGFPAAEYYHPQRHGGTLMCHRAHLADADPLVAVGEKDITAHVNFTGIALAGQAAGFEVLGYATQARFLMNCGLLQMLEGAPLQVVANAQKLLNEHEMGELFKVIGFAKGCDPAFTTASIGFAAGDRTHTL
jgi:SAM-dependent MidA family methyltransferase